MTVTHQFTTAADFWTGMVVPDCTDYRAHPNDLRRALHSAISLFHMHDWIFYTHQSDVTSNFTYIDKVGTCKPVLNAEEFANSLEQSNEDFGRIRGIANAGKHLQLRQSGIRPVQNAPSNAANTRIQTTGWGQTGFGQGPFSGPARVMLQGSNGNDMEYSDIVDSVYKMWEALMKRYNW